MDFGGGRADRISAAVFFVIGAAMAYGGFVMDRLEIRQIHPASIPGLLPMVLGAALMICAVALYASSERDEERAAVGAHSNMDLLFAAVWSVVYAVGYVGHLPFAVATAIYIAGFVGWYTIRERGLEPVRLIFIAVFAIVAAGAVSALFRYGFLVRLP